MTFVEMLLCARVCAPVWLLHGVTHGAPEQAFMIQGVRSFNWLVIRGGLQGDRHS